MKSRFALLALLFASLSARPAHADLLLSAAGANAIYRFDGVSATLFASDPVPASPDSDPNKMHGPSAIVFDPGGNLLVLNEFSHNVLKFNGTTGAYIGPFISSAALGAAGVSDPDDMEIGSDGNLYIMSHFNDGGSSIHRFNATTGAYVAPFSSPPEALHHQHGLAFGPAPGGDVFQGNVDGALVERFNGVTGASMGTFAANPAMTPILDLAFSSTSLYVTTGGAGVKRFDLSGAALPDLIPAGPFASYWGITVDGSDLWISNTGGTGLLRHFNADTGSPIGDIALGGGATDILAMPVPEPATLGLLLPAAALFCLRRPRAASQRDLRFRPLR